MATRCCWPPDSSPGRWSARSAEADLVERVRGPAPGARRGRRRRRRAAARRCARRSAYGSRLNCWNTKPMWRLRTSASWSSSSRRTSCAGEAVARRRSGTSRQPRMCIRVDLPDPDGPMMATNSPCVDRAATRPRRASTSSAPAAVGLADVDELDDRRSMIRHRSPVSRPPGVAAGAGLAGVRGALPAGRTRGIVMTTCSPASRPPVIWTMPPEVRPVVTVRVSVAVAVGADRRRSSPSGSWSPPAPAPARRRRPRRR